MWYRIAIGAGMFLLGYVLGRGVRRIDADKESSGTSRIRDVLSERESESGSPAYATPAPGSGDDIVRE